jgi:hypothetical protein
MSLCASGETDLWAIAPRRESTASHAGLVLQAMAASGPSMMSFTKRQEGSALYIPLVVGRFCASRPSPPVHPTKVARATISVAPNQTVGLAIEPLVLGLRHARPEAKNRPVQTNRHSHTGLWPLVGLTLHQPVDRVGRRAEA